MSKGFIGCLAGILTLGAALAAPAADWPAWRGPLGTGVTTEKELPLKWSAGENVRWRVELPGPGNSSPIVWGDRVFVTQSVKAENRRLLLCFNRKDGKKLWQAGVTYTEKESTHQTNPYCAASPVTDGERVVVSFGSAGLYCYDFAGQELWHRDFGKMNHMFGSAASPVLHGDFCYFNFGPDEKARLIALNKKTGEPVWEALPPKVAPPAGAQRQPAGGRGGRGAGAGASWSTPIVIETGGHEELIVAFPYCLCAFDPASGKQLWLSKGMGENIYVTPAWGEGVLVAQSSGREGGPVIAVKPGGSGDVTSTTFAAWRLPAGKSRTGSSVIREGHIYMIADNGNAECLDLKSGKTVWEQPLKGPGAKKSSWSSMLLAGDRIYVPNQSGDVFVLRAAPKFELLGVNTAGESTNASLAASDGELFLRTDKALWCIAATKQ